MEFTEPSPLEEWYETIELMHGLPSDKIYREQIDLTKEQQPTPASDKVNKRKKEEVTTNTSEQALCELDDLVRKEYEEKKKGTLEDVAKVTARKYIDTAVDTVLK